MDSDRPGQAPPLLRDHVEATAFVHEIVMTADALRMARAFDGEPAMHFDTRSRLLRAIERCGGAPTFTDLGRLLGMSRQAARTHALAAAEAGVVELFQAPDDRRAWQVALTPSGRTTRHVLHVIRQRLERYENDLRAAKRALVSAASARR